MYRKFIGFMTAVALTTGISLQAGADTTPEDAYDYRTAIMESLRGHIRAASMSVRGLVADNGQLVNHAKGLANGISEFDYLFPEGSNVGDSEALPVIWQDREEFAAAIAKAKEASAEFVAAAESGDSERIGGAFRGLGGACRGCHDRFRVDHD
ncbi:MAG: cytochrome c [Woeseiaceae bacterium]|nr:cytochrome c [Woeseiaceae bacterium]